VVCRVVFRSAQGEFELTENVSKAGIASLALDIRSIVCDMMAGGMKDAESFIRMELLL